jgi:lysine 2,3-aminomutase
VKKGALFTYFDPIHKLSPEAQKRWANPQERESMINEAKSKVK